MIKQFEKLKANESELLLKSPVLVSLLAASSDHEISNKEKADAVQLAHLKTFSADPLLLEYYQAVATSFNVYFEKAVKQYAPFDQQQRQALKDEMKHVTSIIAKLDKEFASTLQQSLSKYAAHVRKADRSVLEDFIFPFPIPGLTD